MAKTKISEWDSNPNNNTDIDSINIAEGCAPSGINNAIREVMAQVKDFQQGTKGDPFNGPINGTIGATTPAAGAFTTLTTSGNTTLGDDAGDLITINGTTTFNQSVSIASGSFNGAVGSTTPSTGAFTTLTASGTTTLATVDINGGNIDGTAIGASSASTGAFTTLAASGNVTLSGGTANGVAYLNGSKVLTSGSALTFDGTNLGIGTSSPGYRLHSAGTVGSGSTGENGFYAFRRSSDGVEQAAISVDGTSLIYNNGTGGHIWQQAGTERARIDSSGRWLVNATSAALSATKAQISYSPSADYGLVLYPTNTTYNNASVLFLNNAGTSVGYIYSNGSSTSYVTSSDYRLKHDIQPMTGALAKVAALKPVTYKWKADGSDGEGFIAHELAEVVPQCVTGEKDAVDDEGKPVYQGIDTSFLVATLTAALQEAHGLIKDLQARVNALEAK